MANSKFSSFVFNVIDQAGINEQIKYKRIENMKQIELWMTDFAKNQSGVYHDIIITGSTAEGTLPKSSFTDLDVMHILNGIICVDEASTDIGSQFDILTAEYENVPPGYVKVRHDIKSSNQNSIIATMLSLKSQWYESIRGAPFISYELLQISKLLQLSNLKYNSVLNGGDLRSILINGPATTMCLTIKDGRLISPLDFDSVDAIPFYNSSILTEWTKRHRYYDWPSKELLEEVSTMEGYITPIGEKQSENEHLEWRISHVTEEKLLVQSFNSTQYKLYVVLKLFSKQIFTSVCKSFSSYMVKNVVLWMAELNPSNKFTPGLFIAQLLQSLNFIKHCLMCNHLPSYMMPKKNLIARRIFGHEKRALIILLSSLLNEGACVVYRLPKLAKCLNYVSINPTLFSNFSVWRHVVETHLLSFESDFIGVLFGCPFPENSVDLIHFLDSRFGKLCSKAIRKIFMLTILVIPEFLDRTSDATLTELDNIALKRIQIVRECFFLNHE